MSSIFLLISGPGPWSLDAWLLSGEEAKRDFSVEAPAPRAPLTGRRRPDASEDSWRDARHVVNR
jgi:hypothetical protein